MITLSMAQPLESSIRSHITSLNNELQQCMFVEFVKGDDNVEYPEQKVEEIFAEIEKAESDLRLLKTLRDKANLETKVSWSINEESPNIAEALLLAKQLRVRLTKYEQMAKENPNVVSATRGFGGSSDMLRKPTFNPKEYKQKAQQLQKQVNALSLAIDQANLGVTIDFDASAYLEGINL